MGWTAVKNVPSDSRVEREVLLGKNIGPDTYRQSIYDTEIKDYREYYTEVAAESKAPGGYRAFIKKGLGEKPTLSRVGCRTQAARRAAALEPYA